VGKSAWVRHLAARMRLPELHKRASDLLDPFVGGTEQNIAAAFAEARDTHAFLVFDEGTACCWNGPTRCAAGRSAIRRRASRGSPMAR
jgi:SpoVK/Ycf46/Vps4 family AAA+-type ATPase